MFSKLRLGKSCEEDKGIGPIFEPPKQPEMIYKTGKSESEGPLLLPDEYCLAEDEEAMLEVHCERSGFHLFGLRDVSFKGIPVKVYLTDYRVRNQHLIDNSDLE